VACRGVVHFQLPTRKTVKPYNSIVRDKQAIDNFKIAARLGHKGAQDYLRKNGNEIPRSRAARYLEHRIQ
jgi:hypothetical protein